MDGKDGKRMSLVARYTRPLYYNTCRLIIDTPCALFHALWVTFSSCFLCHRPKLGTIRNFEGSFPTEYDHEQHIYGYQNFH